MLRLPTIRTQFAEVTDRAGHDQLTYRGCLAVAEAGSAGFGASGRGEGS
ncbi:hypothetical protein OG417_51485 [Actinoallomurus sp. NBC_01490]|nr:hypothetical protein [Actinoallomurus sp. NBC_01490]